MPGKYSVSDRPGAYAPGTILGFDLEKRVVIICTGDFMAGTPVVHAQPITEAQAKCLRAYWLLLAQTPQGY